MTLQIENELISSILDKKIGFDEILETNFEARYLQIHHELFEYLQVYYGDNKELPTIDLVTTRFPLYEHCEIKNKPLDLLTAIKKGSEADRLMKDLKRTVTLFQNTGDVEKTVDYISKQLEAYHREDQQDVFELTSPKFTLADLYKKRNDAFLNHGTVGIPTGLGKELDDYINGGLTNGNLYYLIGYSGVSKSWLSLCLGKTSILNGKNVLFLGLESIVEKEYYRFLTMVTGISNTSLMSGKATLDEFKEKEELLKEMVTGKFFLATWGNRDEYNVKTVRQKVDKYKPDILIIDYLSMLSKDSSEQGWKDLKSVSKTLKTIAASKNIPIVCIVQSSGYGKDEVDISDASESKGINADADYMLGVSKVKGKQFMIKINSAKTRDSAGDFSAFYQTSWDKGEVRFAGYDNGEETF